MYVLRASSLFFNTIYLFILCVIIRYVWSLTIVYSLQHLMVDDALVITVNMDCQNKTLIWVTVTLPLRSWRRYEWLQWIQQSFSWITWIYGIFWIFSIFLNSNGFQSIVLDRLERAQAQDPSIPGMLLTDKGQISYKLLISFSANAGHVNWTSFIAETKWLLPRGILILFQTHHMN